MKIIYIIELIVTHGCKKKIIEMVDKWNYEISWLNFPFPFSYNWFEWKKSHFVNSIFGKSWNKLFIFIKRNKLDWIKRAQAVQWDAPCFDRDWGGPHHSSTFFHAVTLLHNFPTRNQNIHSTRHIRASFHVRCRSPGWRVTVTRQGWGLDGRYASKFLFYVWNGSFSTFFYYWTNLFLFFLQYLTRAIFIQTIQLVFFFFQILFWSLNFIMFCIYFFFLLSFFYYYTWGWRF